MAMENHEEIKMRDKNVTISNKGRKFIDQGQAWMYRNNLVTVSEGLQDGDIVDVKDEDGNYVASGFYSDCSHVVVRFMTHDENEVLDDTFFHRQIQEAWNFRKTVESDNLSNCRIIFGDADSIPGLTVDRYENILVTQITCSGIEKRKDMIYHALLETLQNDGENVQAVYERNDVKAREKENLPLYKGFYGNETFDTNIEINENGLKLHVDIENGQKTGYFLDQKSNRLLVRNISHGKTVCDCFTHTGGFALNAAKGNAKHVTAVDVSQSALDQAYENAVLNGIEDRIDFVQADVFQYLDTIQQGQFDIIILDPPAFTKNRRTVDHAYHGYLEINEKAMNALRHGGYLVTCSCSRYMETKLFEQMLKEAATNQHVKLKQISVTQQNADHPIVWNMDETSYLKFYMFQII